MLLVEPIPLQSPLNDTGLIAVLGVMATAIGGIFMLMLNFKGLASGMTVEVKALNDTLTRYLEDGKEHNAEVRKDIEKLDGRVTEVADKVNSLKTQHDMVFKAGDMVKRHITADTA